MVKKLFFCNQTSVFSLRPLRLSVRHFFCALLQLFVCCLALSPLICQAGQVNIQGFNGAIIKAPAVQAQTPASRTTPINIPGSYGPTITPPPPATLPQLLPNGIQQGANVSQPSNSNTKLTIQQT